MSAPRDAENTKAGWDSAALADLHERPDKAVRVRAMFDAIAPTYERVNAVVSLGRDAAWRRRAIRIAAPRPTDIALDICCGTGDMIRALAAHRPAPRRILGVDFAARMLACARLDGFGTPVVLLRADALRLPLRDASVDIVTCAFGVRNFQDLHTGLREMRRVLRPGGRAVILEFAAPDNPIVRLGYRLYTELVLPRVGQWISRDRTGAYRYLPRSIQTFARRHEMAHALRCAGFDHVAMTTMNLGSVVMYRATYAAAPPDPQA